jgi:hypothetical protein
MCALCRFIHRQKTHARIRPGGDSAVGVYPGVEGGVKLFQFVQAGSHIPASLGVVSYVIYRFTVREAGVLTSKQKGF